MEQGFAFPDLGEFRFVSKILSNSLRERQPAPGERAWVFAGDDAAQFDGWLATKDLSAEGTHFIFDWSTPEQAVEKHIVSNVSDISAMGGVPRLALIGVCNSKNWSAETCERIASAFAEGFARRGITLLGGDTVSAKTGLFSTTLLGTPSGHVLRRNAAKPGDGVYVVGTLGKAAAGLWLLMNKPELKEKFPRLVQHHLAPRIEELAGKKLVEAGVRGACMDISDGLSSELNHLALSSKVSAKILKQSLPVDPDVLELCALQHLDPYELALDGGEEYQLVFTSNLSESILGALDFGPITKVGEIFEGCGVYIESAGEVKPLVAGGWSHA